MRSLPAALTTELAKQAHFLANLFKMDFTPTPYYWTDIDQSIYFDSKVWEPAGIKFSDISYGIDQNIATTDVTFPNVDKFFSDLSLTTELRGKAFTIYRALLNNSLNVIGCTTESGANPLPIIIDGYINSVPKMDRMTANFNVVSFSIALNINTPRRVYEPKCGWLRIGGFKGTFCAYAGAETWCDGSKLRCVELANQVNFGGWEFISDLQNQPVRWGQRVKTWGKK
jgi:hypothetical protein